MPRGNSWIKIDIYECTFRRCQNAIGTETLKSCGLSRYILARSIYRNPIGICTCTNSEVSHTKKQSLRRELHLKLGHANSSRFSLLAQYGSSSWKSQVCEYFREEWWLFKDCGLFKNTHTIRQKFLVRIEANTLDFTWTFISWRFKDDKQIPWYLESWLHCFWNFDRKSTLAWGRN